MKQKRYQRLNTSQFMIYADLLLRHKVQTLAHLASSILKASWLRITGAVSPPNLKLTNLTIIQAFVYLESETICYFPGAVNKMTSRPAAKEIIVYKRHSKMACGFKAKFRYKSLKAPPSLSPSSFGKEGLRSCIGDMWRTSFAVSWLLAFKPRQRWFPHLQIFWLICKRKYFLMTSKEAKSSASEASRKFI